MNQAMVASCSDVTHVVPMSPASSGLIDTLTGNTCGTGMPERASALSAGELAMIQSWVLNNALNN